MRTAWFEWQALFNDFELFVKALGQTVSVSVVALLFSLVLGTLFGLLGTAPWRMARAVNRVYVDLIQNTPLVIQVIFLFYALAHVKVVLPVWWVGVLGLGFYHGAYVAEVVRAGIQSIHRGQLEAAFSQGFGYVGAMRHIILPQAYQVVMPPLTNQAVSLIKNSAVLTTIAGGDLMYQADSWAAYNGFYIPAFVLIWAFYFLLCFPLATYARRLEEQVAKSRNQEVKAA